MCIRRSFALAALACLGLAGPAACGRKQTAAGLVPDRTLDRALAPGGFATSLRQAGGGHFHATATLRADVAGKLDKAEAGRLASPPAVTTTTDLWVDKQGNFRLLESNDQDGGREIVRVGGEVAVALRYGKMIRRPSRDGENERLLVEALGAPWTAWELVRRQVEVEAGGQGAYRLKLGSRLATLPAGFPAAEGLRKWRDTVQVQSLEGQVTLDGAGQLPLAFACKATFAAVRDQQPIAGEVAVSATLEDVGKVTDIAMPETETAHPRQRTVLEERALLGRLGSARAPSPAKSPP